MTPKYQQMIVEKEIVSRESKIDCEIRKIEMAIANVHKYKNSNPRVLKLLQFMLDRKLTM